MENFIRIVETVNGAINDFVWGVPCLVLLIGTGLYYTIRLGFMQFRHPVFLFKETIVKAFKNINFIVPIKTYTLNKLDGTEFDGTLLAGECAIGILQ